MRTRQTGSVLLAAAVTALTLAGSARAELPPPEGQNRVAYSFRVVGSVAGVDRQLTGNAAQTA